MDKLNILKNEYVGLLRAEILLTGMAIKSDVDYSAWIKLCSARHYLQDRMVEVADELSKYKKVKVWLKRIK